MSPKTIHNPHAFLNLFQKVVGTYHTRKLRLYMNETQLGTLSNLLNFERKPFEQIYFLLGKHAKRVCLVNEIMLRNLILLGQLNSAGDERVPIEKH